MVDLEIKRFLNGDKNAFDKIYSETKKIVYLSIKVYVKNEADIEDLMQDTYMKVINSLESYQLGSNFKAWISKIARNIAINFINKRNKEVLVSSDSLAFEVEDNHESEAFEIALSVLNGLEKDIFVYKFLLNFTFKDIAIILEMKQSAVSYLYYEALRKIKTSL